MVSNNRREIEDKLKKDIKDILDDLKDLNKDVSNAGEDVDDIKEEVEDTGEDVDEIKEKIEDIQEEVEDTGEDVDDIKEDLQDIKKDLGQLGKKGIFSKLRSIPDKFAFDDMAQQLVGALILSAPFAVTGEVWDLARNLGLVQVFLIIAITLIFDVLLFYYTQYQDIEKKKIGIIPIRILSLLIITYSVSAIMLAIFGVLGGQVTDVVWGLKLIVLVGLFANIGAGAADLIR